MTTVTIHEAKTNLSKLIARVLEGEDVVIAKGREPKVRLVPMTDDKPVANRAPGTLKGKIAFDDSFFDPLPESELRGWEGHGD